MLALYSKPPQGKKWGFRGVRWTLSPLRGSNPPLQDGRGARCPLYYDEMVPRGTDYPPHTDRRLSLGVSQKSATACDTPCVRPLTTCLLSSPDHAGTCAVGGVPAGPSLPAHPPVHFPPPRYDYTRGATGWGLPLHPPLLEAIAKGQSLGKDNPATSNTGGASGCHHTHTCCP